MSDEKKPAEPTTLRQAMQNADLTRPAQDRDYVRPAPPLNYGTVPAARAASVLTRVTEALERADKFADALERATADLERQLVTVKGKL